MSLDPEPVYGEISQFENGLTPASSCSFFERKVLRFPASCAASAFPATAFPLQRRSSDYANILMRQSTVPMRRRERSPATISRSLRENVRYVAFMFLCNHTVGPEGCDVARERLVCIIHGSYANILCACDDRRFLCDVANVPL